MPTVKRRDARHYRGASLQSHNTRNDVILNALGGAPTEWIQNDTGHTGYESFAVDTTNFQVVVAADLTAAGGLLYQIGNEAGVPATLIAATTGVMSLAHGAADNDEACMNTVKTFSCTSAKDCGFYAKVSNSDISENGFITGLWGGGTSGSPYTASTEAISAAVDGIFFHYLSTTAGASINITATQDAVTDTDTVTLSTASADDTSGDELTLAFTASLGSVDWVIQVEAETISSGTLNCANVGGGGNDYEAMQMGLALQASSAAAGAVHFTKMTAWSG